jgi:hypothetical protein
MSYRRTRRTLSPQAQADVIDTIVAKGQEYLSKAAPALGAAQKILEDPYFPKVTQAILELNRLEQRPGAPPKKGVGLDKVAKALGVYVYARTNKWVVPTALAVVIGVPLLLGYGIGKRSRR